MKTQTQIDIPEKFYITYLAKKHKKFITRKGQYSHPDNIFAEGKYLFQRKVNHVSFIGIVMLRVGEWQLGQ